MPTILLRSPRMEWCCSGSNTRAKRWPPFAKWSELQPRSPDAHLNLGDALAGAHDWPQAIAQLKQAIEICGSCSAQPQIHKDLGLIYYHSGDLKNGRAELLVAQKQAPGDEDVTKSLRLLEGRARQNSRAQVAVTIVRCKFASDKGGLCWERTATGWASIWRSKNVCKLRSVW